MKEGGCCSSALTFISTFFWTRVQLLRTLVHNSFPNDTGIRALGPGRGKPSILALSSGWKGPQQGNLSSRFTHSPTSDHSPGFYAWQPRSQPCCWVWAHPGFPRTAGKKSKERMRGRRGAMFLVTEYQGCKDSEATRVSLPSLQRRKLKSQGLLSPFEIVSSFQ